MNPAQWIDISVPLDPTRIPTWPTAPELTLLPRLSLSEGDHATDTTLRMSLHTGTHIDAPSHFVPGTGDVETVGLEQLCGPCTVVALPGVPRLTAAALEAAAIPAGATRILFKTDNEAKWGPRFAEDFVGLDESGARWLVERGVRLVGNDYLSVQAFACSDEVHHVLLRAEVAIVEGLDLSGAAPGDYQLLCLPLRCDGLEAAPARALLLPSTPSST